MSGSLAPRPFTERDAVERAALAHLVQAYCHAIDRQDLVLLRTLYGDDAIDDHGVLFRGSADEYVAWLPTILSKWSVTAHVVTNMLFLLNADDAEGEIGFSAFHRTADETREFVAHGRYLDRYRKEDDVWRFAHRTVVLDWEERRTLEPRPAGYRRAGPIGQPDESDPCYAHLPLFKAQREQRSVSGERARGLKD